MTEIMSIDGAEFVQDEVLPGMEIFQPAPIETSTGTWEEFLWAACNIEDEIKAYGIAKIANATIDFIGIERVLPPQMFYNYSRKGMIAQRVLNEKKLNTNHIYSSAEVFEFLKKYIKKNVAK